VAGLSARVKDRRF